MDNVILIGLSKQMALRRQMDVVANNLANVQTAGFKGEHLVFEEYLMPASDSISTLNESGVRKDLSYVQDARLFRQFAEGAFTTTGNPLDVAINGKGWFVVETENGERFTRNGHFKLNAQGELVTSSGQKVLGQSGPITFGPEETNITISADGKVSSSDGEKDKLRIVSFNNENQLKKIGNNMFSSPAAPQEAQNHRIVQGALESSNVQPVVEMTRMIDVMRSYMSVARMQQNIGDLSRRAIQQLGEVPN